MEAARRAASRRSRRRMPCRPKWWATVPGDRPTRLPMAWLPSLRVTYCSWSQARSRRQSGGYCSTQQGVLFGRAAGGCRIRVVPPCLPSQEESAPVVAVFSGASTSRWAEMSMPYVCGPPRFSTSRPECLESRSKRGFDRDLSALRQPALRRARWCLRGGIGSEHSLLEGREVVREGVTTCAHLVDQILDPLEDTW